MNTALDLLGRILSAWDKFYGKARNALNHFTEFLARTSYCLGNQGPGRGYDAFRKSQILRAIETRALGQARLPPKFGIGLDERILEYPWLFSRLDSRAGRLLDAGSVLNFDYLLRRPELTSKQITISTLAPESECFWWRGVSYTYEDLRHSAFRDETFDWIVCLSTIEHVGMNNTIYTKDSSKNETNSEDAFEFLKQLHRMLKPGGTLYLSFPFGKRGLRDWYQIFDLQAVEKMIDVFQPRMESQTYFRYEANGWRVCAPTEAANAKYGGESETSAIAAEAVACLELVK